MISYIQLGAMIAGFVPSPAAMIASTVVGVVAQIAKKFSQIKGGIREILTPPRI